MTCEDADYFKKASATMPLITLPSPPSSPLDGADWTCNIPDSEHVRFFRSTDWAATELGPLSTWSLALRIHIFMLFSDSKPACLYWGPRRIAIYNEAFVPLAGKAHPILMTSPFEIIFAAIWDHFKGVFLLAETSGKAVDVNEMPMFVERNNFLEETIFTGNFNPLRGDTGMVEGFYNAVFEMTKVKLGERRTKMLNMISNPREIHTKQTVGKHIINCLSTNERDVTVAIMLTRDEDTVPGKTTLRNLGTLGIPDGHPLKQEEYDLDSNSGLMPLLKKVKSEPLTVDTPPEFEGVEWRGFDEPSNSICIIPCWNGHRKCSYLIIGANSRRAIDDDHEEFMGNIARHVSSVLSTVTTAEDAKMTQERLARELAESERKITYLAKHAQVAMQHVKLDGSIIWANDHYFKMTGYEGYISADAPGQQLDVIHPDDKDKAAESWKSLLSGQPAVDVEIRLKRLFVPPFGDPEPATMLCFAFPYFEDDKVVSVMSCMTDVSSFKWAEQWQARSAEEARQAKRQQEEFIDAISHEVRNPLSAIFQLADSVKSSLAELEEKQPTLDMALAVLKQNVEDAKTILLCSNHQKRIVDDVLTLSKLNFMLLSLSPSPVRVPELVDGALKMFEADSKNHRITLSTMEDETYAPSNVDWVMCDPSRVTQIFINLLTNAIKFTKGGQQRNIDIKYGISKEEPWKAFPDDIYWAPKQEGAPSDDITLQPDWGDGEQLYLNFSVADTGAGISQDEMRSLFSRFKQANSKTQIKYGGSGLGLFISQRLLEKQGGDIGIMSEPGKGSTFAFYVKARRTEPPAAVPRPLFERGQSIITELPPEAIDIASLAITEPGTGRIHVLLVEDNIVNQQILKRQLLKAGCVVYVANHGKEALSVLQTTDVWYEAPTSSKPLDVVLMDVEMPVLNGLECTAEIRRLQGLGQIKAHVEIIAITANSRKEQIDMALEAGVDDVMTKPFVAADLMSKIQQRLGRV